MDVEMDEYYERIIPRDLFNEANLLKCYGRLEITRETYPGVILTHNPSDPGAPFRIAQNLSDGSLTISDIKLTVHGHGIDLFRPLNARGEYPLYGMTTESIHGYTDGDVFEIFNDDGSFHADFLERIEAFAPKQEAAYAGPVAHRKASEPEI